MCLWSVSAGTVTSRRTLRYRFVVASSRPSPVKWTHETASAVMLAAGVEPITRYPGTTQPWKCRCVTCHRVVTPSFGNVRRGVSKGCRYCAIEASKGQGRRRWTHAEAAELMLEAGLKPIETFPGADEPWSCECLRCGNLVTPRLSAIRRGASGGCIYCSGHAPAEPDGAARECWLPRCVPWSPTLAKPRTRGGASACAAAAW